MQSSRAERFDGRVVLITGAGAGLGRAYAHHFAKRGATLVVNNRANPLRPNSANAVAAEIVASGGTAIADEHAVQEEKSAQAMIDAVYDRFGRLDVLICNAGVARDESKGLHELTTDAFMEVFNVSLLGTLFPVKAALSRMYEARYGRIIGTTSSAGFFAAPGLTDYASAKTALLGLFRALAVEAQPHGVLANLISPMGWSRMAEKHFDNKYAPLLDPEHVAEVVAWLASKSCQINGEILVAGAGKVYRATVVQSPGLPIGNGDLSQLVPTLMELSGTYEVAHGTETVSKLMAEFDTTQANV